MEIEKHIKQIKNNMPVVKTVISMVTLLFVAVGSYNYAYDYMDEYVHTQKEADLEQTEMFVLRERFIARSTLDRYETQLALTNLELRFYDGMNLTDSDKVRKEDLHAKRRFLNTEIQRQREISQKPDSYFLNGISP